MDNNWKVGDKFILSLSIEEMQIKNFTKFSIEAAKHKRLLTVKSLMSDSVIVDTEGQSAEKFLYYDYSWITKVNNRPIIVIKNYD